MTQEVTKSMGLPTFNGRFAGPEIKALCTGMITQKTRAPLSTTLRASDLAPLRKICAKISRREPSSSDSSSDADSSSDISSSDSDRESDSPDDSRDRRSYPRSSIPRREYRRDFSRCGRDDGRTPSPPPPHRRDSPRRRRDDSRSASPRAATSLSQRQRSMRRRSKWLRPYRRESSPAGRCRQRNDLASRTLRHESYGREREHSPPRWESARRQDRD